MPEQTTPAYLSGHITTPSVVTCRCPTVRDANTGLCVECEYYVRKSERNTRQEATMTAQTDRPEDTANQAYYADMPTRRARVTVEVDVEWRESNPDYSFEVIRNGEMDSPRVRPIEVVSVEWVHSSTPPPKVSVEVWEDGDRADATVADVVRVGDTWHVVATLDG